MASTYVEVPNGSLTQAEINASTARGTTSENTARKTADGYTLLEFQGAVPASCSGYTQRTHAAMLSEIADNPSERWGD